MAKPKVIIQNEEKSVTVAVTFKRSAFRMWLSVMSLMDAQDEMEAAFRVLFDDKAFSEDNTHPAFIERLTDTGERMERDAKAE